MLKNSQIVTLDILWSSLDCFAECYGKHKVKESKKKEKIPSHSTNKTKHLTAPVMFWHWCLSELPTLYY